MSKSQGGDNRSGGVAQHAVDAVATELGIPASTVAAATVDQMYLPAL